MSTDEFRWMSYESPIGPLTLIGGTNGLIQLSFPARVQVRAEIPRGEIPAVAEQLDAYFAGQLRVFDLPLDLRGTPLQREVWRRLLDIPYGQTESYGQLAARVDPEFFGTNAEPWQRARAVGSCNGRNPVAIIVPCHRVIGADGSLTGYGGGLGRKQSLLDLERSATYGDRLPGDWSNTWSVPGGLSGRSPARRSPRS
jgi:methylated-DNA-[protein]-cysteine S-methyltransferase